MPSQDMAQAWSKIFAQAWSDPGFKQRLIADPKSVMQENGINTIGDHPVNVAGFKVEVRENPTAQVGAWHVVGKGADATYIIDLPAKPSDELSDEQLASVAGASSCCCCTCSGAGSEEILL